jgi:hypothetical protein
MLVVLPVKIHSGFVNVFMFCLLMPAIFGAGFLIYWIMLHNREHTTYILLICEYKTKDFVFLLKLFFSFEHVSCGSHWFFHFNLNQILNADP